MTKTLTIEYTPHEKQAIFHRSDKRNRAFVGGIGSGKTMAGCWESIWFGLKNPGALIMVLAPTYTMLRDSTMRTFFELLPEEYISVFNKTKNELILRNGTEYLFRSADDPDRLRGPNLAFIFMDEAAMMGKHTYHILMGRLRQKKFDQRLVVATTPRGFNWLYDVFVKNATEDYAVIYSSTAQNVLNLPPKFVEMLEAQYGGTFYRQEVLGEFVGFEGLVYPDFSLERNVRLTIDQKFDRIIAGVDFGVYDPSVILVIGLDYDHRAYLID